MDATKQCRGPGSAPWMPQVLWPYSVAWASEVFVTSQQEYSPLLQYLVHAAGQAGEPCQQ